MNNPDLMFCWIGLVVVSLFALLVVWMSYETTLLLDYDNADFRRGVTVGREPLPDDIKQFLLELPHDIVAKSGFIKSNGTLVLIWAQARSNRRDFPYVAYIDLEVDSPKIEYRTTLSGFAFLLPHVMTIILVPFVVYFVVSNYSRMKRDILNFIREQMSSEHLATKASDSSQIAQVPTGGA